jgi:hypothetical protein
MIEIKPDDTPFSLADHQVLRDGKKIGWIVEKYRNHGSPIGFLSFNQDIVLTEEEKQELAKLLCPMFHVLYEVKFDSDLYEMMKKEWGRKT